MSEPATPPDDDAWLEGALETVRAGLLLAFPTETLWGLGASASDPDALTRLRAFKGDRGSKPFSVLIADLSSLSSEGFALSPAARALAEEFWPGPLTLVLPCDAPWARQVGGANGSVAVRCSPHPVAFALARGCAAAGVGPLTATSLNRSGEAPARTRAEATKCCGEAGCDLAGPPDAESGGAAESSIVDLSGAEPALLREGAIPHARLERWVPSP